MNYCRGRWKRGAAGQRQQSNGQETLKRHGLGERSQSTIHSRAETRKMKVFALLGDSGRLVPICVPSGITQLAAFSKWLCFVGVPDGRILNQIARLERRC